MQHVGVQDAKDSTSMSTDKRIRKVEEHDAFNIVKVTLVVVMATAV